MQRIGPSVSMSLFLDLNCIVPYFQEHVLAMMSLDLILLSFPQLSLSWVPLVLKVLFNYSETGEEVSKNPAWF